MNDTFADQEQVDLHKRSRSNAEGYDIATLHSYGFDLPASMQINRLTKKMDKWEKMNFNNEIIKEEKEQKVKN